MLGPLPPFLANHPPLPSSAYCLCPPLPASAPLPQVWDAWKSTWTDVHAVLTRAGFLHWFASPEDKAPLEGLALGRAQFEQGEAPVFNLTEGGSRWLSGIKGKKHTFQVRWDAGGQGASARRRATALRLCGPFLEGGPHPGSIVSCFFLCSAAPALWRQID